MFAGGSGEADLLTSLGKADDTEEETGKSFLWNHRGAGPHIQGKIHRDNIGKIPVAAGAGSNLQDSSYEAQKPKEGRANRDWRMSSYER